jgi:hypothetical protein
VPDLKMNFIKIVFSLLLLPPMAFADCNFIEVDISESASRGALNYQGEVIDVEKTIYTGQTNDFVISWYLLSDVSTGIFIQNKTNKTQCESSVKGEYFQTSVYKLDGIDIFAIKHGIGSNYFLEFYDANNCDLIVHADVSSGTKFSPAQNNADSLINPGYCKCEDRSNDCIGEPSYCYPGQVYTLSEQCTPSSGVNIDETSLFNKKVYGIDFSNWTHIDNAKTDRAKISK